MLDWWVVPSGATLAAGAAEPDADDEEAGPTAVPTEAHCRGDTDLDDGDERGGMRGKTKDKVSSGKQK